MWSHLGILGLGGVLHRVLEQVVLLAQLHTLAPPKTIQCKGLLLLRYQYLLLPLYR